jgi:hypothetical protein
MKPAALADLKKELSTLPPQAILDLCIRLAKYKKENKELLTYLLFDAYDPQDYIQNIKDEIDEKFSEINKNNIYFAGKGLRKILRFTNKYIKYTGSKKIEAELLIYFLSKLKNSGIAIHKSTALKFLYQAQVKKITKAVSALHPDLQYDFEREMESLFL